ncbi:MAG TPA: SEC-C metal-binding domain-containing protein [Thermoanaerobaculia bacterium]|nr:SEC-C metal-binding domain-containing protein [Thermoanaerobaculia bacterium]
MARVSRNDPCPCGSGLKYKRCHEGKDVEKPRTSGMLLLAILALLIGAGALAVVIGITRGPDTASSSRRRVWSPEHGHWHDVVETGGSKNSPPPIGITYGPAPNR